MRKPKFKIDNVVYKVVKNHITTVKICEITYSYVVGKYRYCVNKNYDIRYAIDENVLFATLDEAKRYGRRYLYYKYKKQRTHIMNLQESDIK